MSKIFLIGDTHIGLGYPNSLEKWFLVHKEYFSKFLIPLLESQVEEGDIIVHLGDYFDNRNVIPINLLNYGMDIVEQISAIAPLHIIIGNHDLYTKSLSEINSVRPFKYIPNVKIYDKPEVLEYTGLKILMMPYIENRSQQIEIINENKNCDYLFCHSDLNGCKMHLTSVAHKNTDKIDIEHFEPFKKVRSGHIHLVQTNQNFTFVGSIFQMDRNDYGDQKGIFVINTQSGEEKFYENNISPVFKKFTIRNEEDILSLESYKNTKDYIDLLISNSLLINNRKVRRKLEIILESGNFSKIEYVDDLVLENDNNNKSVIDEITEEELSNGVVPSIQLEYTDLIRQYINSQKYESEKIKSGVLQEFNEIVKIYDEGFQ